MKIKKIFLLITVFFLLSSGTTFADTGHTRPLEEILDEIKIDQNIESVEEIDCSKVSEEELEELGDAVMSKIHPDEEVHNRMDEMMGGEGSGSLRVAHINMALSYLECGNGRGFGGMMGMMTDRGMMNDDYNFSSTGGGVNMMGWGGNGFGYGMMNPYFGGFFGILGVVFWILLIALLVAMIRYFWRKGDRK